MVQVLCERCSGLCNGAMIPAVEDFTQKALRQQQEQQQQQLLQQQAEDAVAAAAGQHTAAAAAEGGAAAAAGDMDGTPLELLGKLLISPEELKEKLMVRVWRHIGGFEDFGTVASIRASKAEKDLAGPCNGTAWLRSYPCMVGFL